MQISQCFFFFKRIYEIKPQYTLAKTWKENILTNFNLQFNMNMGRRERQVDDYVINLSFHFAKNIKGQQLNFVCNLCYKY